MRGSVITFGSLFAGIGGIDLGLERAGMACEWQVEIDDYANRVLAKHWPDVRRWEDIRTFPPGPVADWKVDLICGGFPCQDISYAGRGAGLGGERSGLFYEAMRVVRILEPRYVVLENVAALLTRGLDVVLGTLASLGYDAEWHCIPAAAVGAPHIRDRVFIVAYANNAGSGTPKCGIDDNRKTQDTKQPQPQPKPCRYCSAFFERWRCSAAELGECDCPKCQGFCECTTEHAKSGGRGARRTRRFVAAGPQQPKPERPVQNLADTKRFKNKRDGYAAVSKSRCESKGRQNVGASWWSVESDVGRVADGVPDRVDRLRCLGNAVVPQVAEWIGRAIIQSEPCEVA